MIKTAFVFPGQGSQFVGMGKDFTENYSEARAIFQEADESLECALSNLCFNGPEEELKLTINTQPAILTTSIAILKLVEQEGITADFVAGHSLGEYSALVAAESLSFQDAVRIVRQRGAFMQEAVPPGEGTMAAIMGLSKEKVEEICQKASAQGIVEPANYNSPVQIVVAGAVKGVEKAVEIAKEEGAKRTVMLPVSGPFHSSLLKPASLRLKEVLDKINIVPAKIPVVANITAEQETEPELIRKNLIDQVSGAVRWQQSVEKLQSLGVKRYIEIGPGKVLSGLIKKVDKTAEIYNIGDVDSFKNTIAKIKGV